MTDQGAPLRFGPRELRISGHTVTMVFDLEGQERATLTVRLSSDRRGPQRRLSISDDL